MLGAIAGDIIGSVHEWAGTKTKDFPLYLPDCRFTDDTVLSVAVAECLLRGGDYAVLYRRYFQAYPGAGYGGTFLRWAASAAVGPYQSWGNGSAMRVSPVGYYGNSLDEVLAEARRSAEVTHNHAEGIKGAQATAAAIFLARTGHEKSGIREYVEQTFGYDLKQRLEEIRPAYKFDVSCQGSVPQSIIAFFESEDYEDAVRNAISLGGDADTMACIVGGIAAAYYGVIPAEIREQTLARLDDQMRSVVEEFTERFGEG